MTRGTTPTCRFALPFAADTLSSRCISFAQRGVEKFSVDSERAIADGSAVTVTLTQEETLALEAGVDAQIQLRGIVADTGEVIASQIVTVAVEPILREGVIE